MEQRTYQGQTYRRNSPNEDWQLVSDGPGSPVVSVVPSNPALVAKQADEQARRNRAEERAIEAAARAAAAAERSAQNIPSGYQPDGRGGLTFIPGGPADPANAPANRDGKSLRQADGTKLSALVDQYAGLKNAALGFQDDFAGNTLGGEVENWAQGLLGTGTKGQRDWWSAFRSTDNLIRNDLFGASLTEGEKRAYEQTTVSPSMTPEIVRQNVGRRVEILRKGLERQVDRYRAAGFNEAEIEALAGEYAPDFGIGKPWREQAPKFEIPKAAGVGAAKGMEIDGATGEGGLKPIPELRGIENQVIDMIGKGASTGQVVDFLDDNLNKYGAQVSPELMGYLGDIVRKHKANPRQPVRSLGEGWENLWHRQVPEGESTALGRFADTPAGNFAMNTINSAFAGAPAWAAGKGDVLNAANTENPNASFAGKITGGLAALTGIQGAAKAAGGTVGGLLTRGGGFGGDVLYGSAQGGFEDGPLGIAKGAVAAAVGNKVGSSLASGTGRAIRGVTDPVIKRLSAQNVPLTVGMIAGRNNALGRFMNTIESAPGINGLMARRYQDARAGVNRAAFDEAVEGIPGAVTDIGMEGMQQAYGLTDQAYADALGGRTFNANEPQFIRDMGDAIARGQAIPKLGEDFAHVVRSDVAPMFDANGVLTADRLQAALQGLRKRRSSFAGQPLGDDIGSALTDVETSLTDMVGRQAPDVMPKLNAANTAYRKINVLGDAVNAAGNEAGEFSAAQLNRASINNTKKFLGKRAAATGQRPFQQLGDDAQKVIPSKVGDSGTAPRWAAMALPGVLAGGAYGSNEAGAGPAVTVPLAVLAALTSKTGARVAQKALTGDRPDAVAKIGNALVKHRRKAGLFGAAVAPNLLQ